MLPKLADIKDTPAELFTQLTELLFNPVSLAVVAQVIETGMLDALRGDESDAPHLLRARLEKERSAVSVAMISDLALHIGVLERGGAGRKPSALARTFFAKDAPLRVLGLVERYASYLPKFSSLPRTLLDMSAADRRMWSEKTSKEEQHAHFANALAFSAARRSYFWDSSIQLMRAHLHRDFGKHRHLIDLCSGPAGFAALAKRCFPHLVVGAADISLAFDDFKRETERALSMEQLEVELYGINVLHDPLPARADLVTAHRLLSGVAQDSITTWVERLATAVEPGGTLALTDFFTTGDASHDRHVANLYTYWATGGLWELERNPPKDAADEKASWGWNPPVAAAHVEQIMRSLGFRDVRVRRADPPFCLVEGEKP